MSSSQRSCGVVFFSEIAFSQIQSGLGFDTIRKKLKEQVGRKDTDSLIHMVLFTNAVTTGTNEV